MNDKEAAGGAVPAALASLPPRALAARMADAVIARRPPERSRWSWEDGILADAVDRTGRVTGEAAQRAYASMAIGRLVDEEGRIEEWREPPGDLLSLQPGMVLATLYADTGLERFRRCLCMLRGELRRQPRTRAGGFWSSRGRPFQMWMDALSVPFHARCVAALGETEAFDDAVHQILVMEERARDPRTGLPSHAWDESRRQLWSNPESGRSPTVWTLAVGRFAAAAVETLDALPADHHGRLLISAMLARLASVLEKWQDPATGLWAQVTDQPGREGNSVEPTGSCLLSYAFARAVRRRCIDAAGAWKAARRAWTGVVSSCLGDDGNGLPRLHGCSAQVSLGGTPYRDGSFSCYASAPRLIDEPVGVAALILASLEMDAVSCGAQSGEDASAGRAASGR